MEFILQKVKIIDPRSKYHLKVCDIKIQQGVITQIAKDIPPSSKSKILNCKSSCVSPYWIDFGAACGEPGYEYRETLASLSNAAIAGGYGAVFIMPNNKPFTHSKTEVHAILAKSESVAVTIYPVGAISKEGAGKEMAEMLDMNSMNVNCFSDGSISIQNSGLLLRSLEYSKLIPNSVLVQFPFDQSIGALGQMHEGHWSTFMGLKGIPAIAEELMVQRDIKLNQYAEASLMLHKISTQDSVAQIKRARKESIKLFSSVSVMNLAYEDKDVLGFKHQLKLMPPLRSKEHRKALIAGLIENTIDLICSDHTPWDPEKKELEFQQAAFGGINLQTAYSVYKSIANSDLTDELWVQKVSIRPREIFSLPEDVIDVDKPANISWWDPNREYTFTPKENQSLSENSFFINQKRIGKALGVFIKGQFHLSHHESKI
ncbi:MAG TPA: dihydroorotase [Saprospiraceae bacterium]|nr:dihydroorotase [Saprospiraceae bacterium]